MAEDVYDRRVLAKIFSYFPYGHENSVVSMTSDDLGYLHSFDDNPAVIFRDGTKLWYDHGKLHRENGPSVIDTCEKWHKQNRLHRIGGPAITWSDGTTVFAIDGEEYSEHEYWFQVMLRYPEYK